MNYYDLERKQQTLFQAVYRSAKQYPNRRAYHYMNRFYNYDYLLKHINIFANNFLKMGFKENDVITVCLPNIPQACFLFYAINQIGAIANLVHPLVKREQIEAILDKVGSKILFCLDTSYDEMESLKEKGITVVPVCPAKEALPIVRFAYRKLNAKKLTYLKRDYFDEQKFFEGKPLKKYQKDFFKDALYLHSGGTTGEAKTIALSSFSINALANNDENVLDFKQGQVRYMLSVLPMFHGFGLTVGIHLQFFNGTCNILMPKFSAKDTVKHLKKKRLNYIIGVPTLYEALLKNKGFSGKILENLKACYIGGDFVSESLLARFNARFEAIGSTTRLLEGYGLTETVTVCAVNTKDFKKAGTVGKALYNINIQVSNDEGVMQPPNTDGEICVSGESLMNGYRYNSNKKINDEVFFHTEDGTKWIHTGDFGSVDEDGYVHFKQRIKRMIKVNGIIVFPSEVENIVSSLPFIFECAATEVKDEKRGSMIKLFVSLNKNFENKNYDVEINNAIENRLSTYAKPKEIVYLEKFPHTLVGKIDVKVLK